MASNRTGDGSKAVRFSETEARGVDEEKGRGEGRGGKREGQERYEPLPVMGGIKEKGFSTASVSSAPVSLPNPSVTAFPVARHRSQGPHWLPVKKDEPVVMSKSDGEELGTEALSALAQPLVGKKKAAFSASRWKMKKSSDSAQEIIKGVPNAGGTLDKLHEVVPIDTEAPLDYYAGAAAAQARNNVATSPSEIGQSQAVLSGGKSDDAEAIDAENRAAIAGMSAAEVVEAQTELMQRLKPEVLEMLRRRGLKKLSNLHADHSRSDQFSLTGKKLGHSDDAQPVESVKTGSNAISAQPVESVKTGSNAISAQPVESVKTGSNAISAQPVQSVKTGSNETSAQPIESVKSRSNETSVLSQELPVVEQNVGSIVAGKYWTERVEAVRLHKFDLEGNLLGIDHADDTSSAVTLSEQSIAERDYLRSEGNPAAIGYSLKEATDLIRSTFPGHRVFALRLIAAVLNKAIMGIQTPNLNSSSRTPTVGEDTEVDWQAVWAYALGPEPQLVLTLRLALDDKHTTVVVACSKALQAILSYSANEAISDLHEAFWPGNTSAFTAPIFRRHTKPSEGFLGGGHWKYNVKTHEMFPFSERASSKADDDDDDGKDTVGDDGTVASKDVAAGFIRMGILPRIRFILEVEKIAGANEPLLSVVIALACHSPAAANAVVKCPRLMDSIIQQFFLMDDDLDAEVGPLRPAHTKAIQLLKVLLLASRMNCIRFAESGALQVAQCELYKQGYPMQLHRLHPRPGEESFEGVRSTIIESLRLWRVCIHYRMGISLFSDIYPALCFWLVPLSAEEITSNNKEDALYLAQESYMLLESLAQTLPRLHFQNAGMSDNETEESICLNWTWQVAIPMVGTAIRWLSTDRVSAVTEQLVSAAYGDEQLLTREDGSRTKLVGMLASLFHFLATVSEKILGNDDKEGSITNSPTPWLPTFIPQLGLLLASNQILNYRNWVSEAPQFGSEKSTLFASLCAIRHRGDYEMSLAATSCLHGLVRLLNTLDRVIGSSKPESALQTNVGDSSEDQQILFHGLVASGSVELRGLLALVGKEVMMNSHILQSCEEIGRGGPAPGLGLGWGSVGGGAWSKEVLVAQASARLVAELLEVLPLSSGSISQAFDHEMRRENSLTSDLMWRISCSFGIAAISDPKNGDLVEKSYSKFLLHPNVLECLFQNMECILKGRDIAKVSSGWMKKNLDLSSKLDPKLVQKLLSKNFRETWTSPKLPKSSKRKDDGNPKLSKQQKSGHAPSRLATVCEEAGSDSCYVPNSLMREWARQRLPLPTHWLLSPMATNVSQFLDGSEGDVLAGGRVSVVVQEKLEMEQVVKAGILWLLSLEALNQTREDSESTFIATVPLIRKLHALSTVFVLGGDVFLHEDVQEMVGTLQEFYGHQLDSWQTNNKHTKFDEWRSDMGSMPLDFDHIDGTYSTFAETLSEQFGASSYGDLVFARQVAIYLRQGVPDSVRLAIWRGLADAHVLKLLPPLIQCCGQQWGYLYPFERNNQMVEVYVSAWTSGAYDAAIAQHSMSFALALHHIFGYIFVQGNIVKEKLAVDKVIRTLVRSSTRKSQQQGMLKQLLEYQPPSPTKEISELSTEELDKRVRLLSTACKGDLSLVGQVERLQRMTTTAR